MLIARLGHFLDKPLRGLSLRIKIHPNILSFIGFLITLLSALSIPYSPLYGGLLLMGGGLFDMLDGIVARNRNLVSAFGAFLDSTLDRISDGVIFIAISIFFYQLNEDLYCLISLFCLLSAYLVSYTRARIEGLGGDCRVGLAERPERILILIAGLLSGYIREALWVILITSIITISQRIYHASRVLR